uniref:Phospholipase A2 n=1 Tax=Gopherus agassizii TaxID=38772 RepID=A0A452I7S2_9SAUR
MKFAMWLMLVTLLSQSAHEAQCSRRGRRSLLELGLTLWCYRQRLQTPLFALNLYGCYCGTGGSGTPLDAVDQCCFLHDCCYRHARVSLECRGRVKWQPYEFACSQSGTECRSQSVCGRMACECDRQFAECLTEGHQPSLMCRCRQTEQPHLPPSVSAKITHTYSHHLGIGELRYTQCSCKTITLT